MAVADVCETDIRAGSVSCPSFLLAPLGAHYLTKHPSKKQLASIILSRLLVFVSPRTSQSTNTHVTHANEISSGVRRERGKRTEFFFRVSLSGQVRPRTIHAWS